MKILFFDYWTRGINNFSRLRSGLVKNGNSVLLIHTGSWREDHVPLEETIDGIVCRDIQYYHNHIGKALRIESPDIVIGLNYSHFLDRILVRYCKKFNIRSIHLMHGVRNIEVETMEIFAENINRSISFLGKIKRLRSYFRLFYHYYYSRERAISPTDLKYFLRMMLSPGRSIILPEKSHDLLWDKALVYSQAYKTFFIDHVGFQSNRVKITGNPELDSAIRLIESNNADRLWRDYLDASDINLYFNVGKIFLLIDQPVVELGLSTEDIRINELIMLASACERMNYDLIVKLHPSTNSTQMFQVLKAYHNIHLISESKNELLIEKATIVAGRSSTLLMTAIVLKKPIVQIYRDDSNSDTYDPIILHIEESELNHVLLNPAEYYSSKIGTETINEYIKEKIGPIDGRSTQRIIRNILSEIS
jgi:hypothetical protein